MRSPINGTLTITNPFGEPGYGVFGKHAGVDLRAAVGTPVYAPATGVVTENYIGTSGIKVLGVEINGRWHRFLHLNDVVVKSGSFAEGQLIAHSGNTGNVAAHLHWDVRTKGTAWNRAFSDYINPLSLLTNQGGIVASDNTINQVFQMGLERNPDPGAYDTYRKTTDAILVNSVFVSGERQARLAQRTKQITDLQTALANEQNKPPREVIKEVQVIVEKPV